MLVVTAVNSGQPKINGRSQFFNRVADICQVRLFFCYKQLKLGIANRWHYLWKKYSNSKTKKEVKIRRHSFLEKLSDSKLANFSPIGSRVADLEFKTYPQLDLIFISRKQGKKIFGGVLPVTRL